jgi:hypothetical protein
MTSLADRACVPCRGGVPPLTSAQIAPLLAQLEAWNVAEEHHLEKTYRLPNFAGARQLVNRIRCHRRRAEPPSRPVPRLGRIRGEDLDTQDQRP